MLRGLQRTMTRRPGAKTLSTVQLTPEQYLAVRAEASRLDLDVSRYVRSLLAQHVPGFTDDFPRRGTYDRRRLWIASCIRDDDEVVAPAVHAVAWQEAWHRTPAGTEVPTIFKLRIGDDKPQSFKTLRDLLDAMVAIASFDQWRVEGEDN